ncbi:hypothetical protein [Hymenobacter lucidus]|uniref:XRE family transcriptional regulator n=1 Tax=Hymenobacter lucidus TaxID=2880930 RepID=A0ABS8AST2_9BACT|nr:hypothetical protein [Hymenobacter lucidus]MCB2407766.1 hypothetical protein [Hymenobacter lucidus]
MSQYIRTRLSLTQERLANWLGIPRASLALAERDHQPLPYAAGVQLARLLLALHGQVFDPAGNRPAPPPLPIPLPEQKPLLKRIRYCEHHAARLRRKVEMMRTIVEAYETRLAVLPALWAWTGEVRNPALEKTWLALLEGEAMSALLDTYGAGPQKLLEARIAGLEREAEVLRELVEKLPAAPAG